MKTGSFSNPFRNPFANPFGKMISLPWMTVALLPPRNISADVDGSDITITIGTAAKAVDGYHYYQSIDGGAWTKLNATPTTELTYTFTPTVPGEYSFRVTSVRDGVESAPSAETLTSEAMMEQVYSATLSPRISAVDGTAFVDGVAAITDYADGNHLLEIEDSEGKVLSGVIKAQGIGETLGSDLLSGFDFTDSGWFTNANITGANTFTNLLTNAYVTKPGIGGAVGNLIKIIHNTTESAGTTNVHNSALNQVYVAGDGTAYRTMTALGIGVRNDGGGVGTTNTVHTLSVQLQTTPSTSGATLVNSIFGTTQNLVSVDAEFAFNAASYIVRVKRILPVAEWTVTSGSIKLATGDGVAMFFHDDISFASYAGASGNTPYKFTFTDEAGKKAVAWGGAVGGGNTVGSEIIPDPTCAIDFWDSKAVWTHDAVGEKFDVNTASIATMQLNSVIDPGSLYTYGFEVKNHTSGDAYMFVGYWVNRKVLRINSNTSGAVVGTADPNSTVRSLYLQSSSGVLSVDNITCKKLTDISATGLHLMSAKDGTTKSMASMEASFNPNVIVHVEVSLE